MPFPTEDLLLTSAELATHLKVVGGSPEGEVDRLRLEALEHLDQGFADAWREVPVATANECLIRVAQSLMDAKRGNRSGQQRATVEGGTNVRPSLDPLETVRPILDRYVVRL
jgi:hypothetical protein